MCVCVCVYIEREIGCQNSSCFDLVYLHDSHTYKITCVRKITGPESCVQVMSTNTYRLCDLCRSLNYSVYTSSYRYELKISTLYKSYI